MNNTEHGPPASEQQAIIGRVVEGLLASIPPQVADTIRLAAIPNWFEQKLLARLGHGELDVAQAMAYLQRLRFVRQDAPGQFRYHDEVRDYLLAWWRQERPRQYEAANQAALAYFSGLAEAATSVERPVYEREVLYHLLIADETAGLRYLNAQFEDACGRYQLGLAEGLVIQAAQLEDTLKDEGRLWLGYLQARLDLLYRRGDTGAATFRDLADHAPDVTLQALARWNLGQIQVNQQHWSEAIRLYRAGLASLQQERELLYAARVLLALGDAYYDLADNSGGFQARDSKHFGAASRFLHSLQHLPFLIYEWLVRRVRFLPNWYFGTNYQDWIVAYLLFEAAHWYRRAERQLMEIDNRPGLVEARLALAELEHQVGRWSRARRQYVLLQETDEIKGSLYRTARVRLGQGRAFLDEGDLVQAETALAEAFETFRNFQDDRSVGVTATLLGRLYAARGRVGEAVPAYVASAQAFETVTDQLAYTQVIWALKDLAQDATLLDDQRRQVDEVVAQVAERHYVTRFPDALLRRFRRLALLGALPLTYVLTFIVGLALTLSLAVIEGEFLLSRTGANAQTTIADAVILTEVATLPVPLALWLYRLIYTLLGLAVVRSLGRRLVPIEREQPSYLVTNAMGLTLHDVSKGLSRTLAWSDVTSLASVDCYLWRRPIQLISGTILTAGSEAIWVDAITAGYDHLKQDVVYHLGYQQGGIKQQRLDFVIFEGRWTFAAIIASLGLALYLFFIHKLTYQVTSMGKDVSLLLTSMVFWFVPMLLLLFPAMVLWRLVSHQITVRATLRRYQVKPTIPSWVFWLAAIGCTLIAALWIVFLLLVADVL